MRARVLAAAILVGLPFALQAQQGRGQGPGRGADALNFRTNAPVDLTGYWESLITDDWRYRMLTPPKGNVDYLPMTAEARRLADQWIPSKTRPPESNLVATARSAPCACRRARPPHGQA